MKITEKTNQEIIEQLTKIANNFDSSKENYLLSSLFELFQKSRNYKFREFNHRNKLYLFLDADNFKINQTRKS